MTSTDDIKLKENHMKCAECSKPIDCTKSVKIGEYNFCNNLCRVVFQKNNNDLINLAPKAKEKKEINLNPVLIKPETMDRFRFAVSAILLICLGIFAILNPDVMQGHSASDVSGRNWIYKVLVMYIWGIPAGILFIIAGIAMMKSKVFKK